MPKTITAQLLTREAFAPFGEVIDADNAYIGAVRRGGRRRRRPVPALAATDRESHKCCGE